MKTSFCTAEIELEVLGYNPKATNLGVLSVPISDKNWP